MLITKNAVGRMTLFGNIEALMCDFNFGRFVPPNYSPANYNWLSQLVIKSLPFYLDKENSSPGTSFTTVTSPLSL